MKRDALPLDADGLPVSATAVTGRSTLRAAAIRRAGEARGEMLDAVLAAILRGLHRSVTPAPGRRR